MSDELVKQPIVWVSCAEELELMCDAFRDLKMLAIDTEFMRSNTYYPIAGVIQINDGETNFLIDPQAIDDFGPLEEILVDDDIVISIHSGSEDMEVFHRKLGFLPSRLFDTQLAGAFCGLGFSLGFANMVQSVFDVSLPKTQTRSDWLARPLSLAQQKYAALDVEYLYQLAAKLIDDLQMLGRLEWAFSESKQLIKNFSSQLTPEKSYLRSKQAHKLNSEQLCALQCLCKWREELAQVKDKPRNHIVKENALFAIACALPTHISQLRNTPGLSERFIHRYGEKLIAMVEQAKNTPIDLRPSRVPKPLSSSSLTLIKQLRASISEFADGKQLAPEILLKKKDYEFIVSNFEKTSNITFPYEATHWRQNIVSPIIQAALTQQKASNGLDDNECTGGA